MISQNRITLTSLKVAAFASDETWCFETKVCLDGKVIANAHNSGDGGCTFINAISGKDKQLEEAEAFAKSLPALVSAFNDPKTGTNMLHDVDLELVVDTLVSDMQNDKKLRARFKREFPKKMLYVKDDGLYAPRIDMSKVAAADKSKMYNACREQNGQDIIILAELPEAKAWELYKKTLSKG